MSDIVAMITVQQYKLCAYLQVQTEGLIRDHNVTIAFLKEELRDVKVCKDLHDQMLNVPLCRYTLACWCTSMPGPDCHL